MKTERKAWRNAGIVLLLTMVATPFIAAQQATPTVVTRPASPARASAPGDAIQVHGHWIIDVRNPDGTLASHHDFQNALLPAGQQLLSYLVSNAASIVTWDIRLRTSSLDGTGPCEPAVDTDSSCYIVGPGSTLFPTPNLPNVFATGSFVRTPAGTLEISGNVTAASAQSIGYVESIAEPTGFGLTPFSGRALATPIQVAVGQILYVKVIVSFGEPDTGGGGGGSGLDSDGDGIPDTLDACPADPNPSVNGVPTPCPPTLATIHEIKLSAPPTGTAFTVNGAFVTDVSASAFTINDDTEPDPVNGLVIQLNGLPAPTVGNVVTVSFAVTGSNSFSAIAITVTGNQ